MYLLQACKLDSHHVEALLLKGTSFFECKQAKDALGCFRDALNIAPYRFEVYKGMFYCSEMFNTEQPLESAKFNS